MSVYNGENYLKEAIESILNQTFVDFEFIIIDDASDDKSYKIICGYEDDRIVVIQNKHNVGLTSNLNLGLKLAKGKYIARMDADDISLYNRLELQINFLEKHPEFELVGSSAILINETGNKIGEISRSFDHQNILGNIFFFNPIIHPSILFKKSFFEAVGNYDEEILKAQDYELWFRMVAHSGKAFVLSEPLIEHREHSESIESKYSLIQEENVVLILKKWLANLLDYDVDVLSITCFRKAWQNGRIDSYSKIFPLIIFLMKLNLKFGYRFSNKPKAIIRVSINSLRLIARVLLRFYKDRISYA